MKILSMTATFGKLEGQTLTLEPGLNVITAPNEWGKSTWCAFVVAMLYGIETSQRTSSKGLADKERYAPWSGKPISGRMDIVWNDRKITLERSTKGRSIFGVFKAYETDTGLEVSELTAENCGLTLLGVEKSVFARAGFVRQTEMPVTDDLALRRRLNELVTTGDESGASDKLAQKLKELKNQCRHNKTGLLPQAENQRAGITEKLEQIQTAQTQIEKIHLRQAEVEQQLRQLENHKIALAYEGAKQNMARVDAAKAAHDQALEKVRLLESQSAALPAQEFAQRKLQQAQALQGRWTEMQAKALPRVPETPAVFGGLGGEAACLRAKQDKAVFDALQKPQSPLLLILAGVCLTVGVGLAFINPLLIFIGILGAAVPALLHLRKGARQKHQLSDLLERYGNLPADMWVEAAKRYLDEENGYRTASEDYNREKVALQEDTDALTGGRPLSQVVEEHQRTLALWRELEDARKAAQQARQHADTLAEMVEQVPAPEDADTLTLTSEQTAYTLAALDREQQDLQKRMGQFMGQIQTLGSWEDMNRQLEQINRRIEKLEDTYAALTIAQETLTQAANELQRRFAPKIAEKARSIFSRLTAGRYDRLVLGQDISVNVGAEGEDVLHGTAWRSDGTVDQLYLALRLAVAQALTPEAPLVLDDALVRFDDTRLASALTLLQEVSETKQVLLFTCQTRESKITES